MLLSIIFSWTFPEIVDAIPEGPFCYPGKYPREIIVVEPEHSPLLETATKTLISRIRSNMSEIEILAFTMQFVQEELFSAKNSSETVVQALASQFPGEEPEIPLDIFLTEKTGNCRHIALTTTYLIDQLIKQGILSGIAFLIREETPKGRHAWTLLLNNEHAWHLDIAWGILVDAKTPKGYAKLCQYYGKEVMKKQKQRWK